MNRRRQRGRKDWALKHQGHVLAWDAKQVVVGGPVHRDGPFKVYLQWLKANTRLKLKLAIDAEHVEDLPSDPEDVFPEYDEFTRQGNQPERGPFQDYIVSTSYDIKFFNKTQQVE